MTEPVSSAQYFPWDGGAIFVGTAGVLPAHAHQAIQICFLFEGRIRLRPSDEDQWLDCDLGIVPSQHTHGIANLDRAPVDSIVRELRAAVRERRGRAAIVALARRLVQQLTQHSEPAVTSDERIVRAVTYVNDHLSAPLTLKQVAGVAHLSPSRFRHLYAQQGQRSAAARVLPRWPLHSASNAPTWASAARNLST